MNRNQTILRAILCLFVALGFSPAYAANCSDDSVGDFVQDFYQIGGHPSSVPTLVELQDKRYPFSNRLHRLLVVAAQYRDEFIENHPPEPSSDGAPPLIYKPPFVDGDIFKGPQDGSQFFRVTAVRTLSKGRWDIRVKSLPEPNMSPWAVSVIVLRENGRCAIDDILYPPYSDSSTLSKSLDVSP